MSVQLQRGKPTLISALSPDDFYIAETAAADRQPGHHLTNYGSFEMQADFFDAHERHWEDAETLYERGRYANADHLYGISVECGLKRLMISFGMTVDPATGSPTRKNDREHANRIWARFESYRSGRMEGADYTLPSSNPFSNWDVSDRYGNQSHFTQKEVSEHQAGGAFVRFLIKKAQKEGLLP